MWNVVSIIILAVQLILLTSYIIGKMKKKKLNESLWFICTVFFLSFVINLVPYIHSIVVLKNEPQYVLDLLNCLSNSLKLFVGTVTTNSVSAFAKEVDVFNIVYLFGVGLAVLATVNTFIESFENSIKNNHRLKKLLNAPYCDILVGENKKAMIYARNNKAVFLLDKKADKAKANELIEKGFAVIRRSFTKDLFNSQLFNARTRYNVICMRSDSENVRFLNEYLAYEKSSDKKCKKSFHLYIETDSSKAQTVHREIIEPSGCGDTITTFCSNELMARTFIQKNPISKYMPQSFIEDGALRPDVVLNVFFMGFGELSRELYRQSIFNNQFVSYKDGEYKCHPVNYYIYDEEADEDEWYINGLKNELDQLPKDRYLPLPEIPFNTKLIKLWPERRTVLMSVKETVQKENSYSIIIIDEERDYLNADIGARLDSILYGLDSYRIFVRSTADFAVDRSNVSYYGKQDKVINHSVIVNDSLSLMAKKLNEVYTAQYEKHNSHREDFAHYVKIKAMEEWTNFDSFTRYSNLYAAMNLRVKLNLLGLDYVCDGKKRNLSAVEKAVGRKTSYTFGEYLEKSVRNALIAQEHTRWNAYHLLCEYMPLEKENISIKSEKDGKIRFNAKDNNSHKHVCLTTYNGLTCLAEYFAKKAGEGFSAADYDYYVYDEMLITSVAELFENLGYSLIEKE